MSKIAVIDCDSVIFSIINPNKVLDEVGNPVKKLSEAGNMVNVYEDKTEEEIETSAKWFMSSILLECKAVEYVGFLKGKDTVKNKTLINPEYKANRTGTIPFGYEFARNYLVENYNVFKVDDLEVDDAVNIYRLAVPDSFICAIDSDLLSLEGTHFNWRKKEWVTTKKDEADYIFWKNMITGTHNATKGIPRKGEKYVLKAFEQAEIAGEFLDVATYREFTAHFGIEEGIKQFYSNYICTKILEKSDIFDFAKYPTQETKSIFKL